VGEEGEVTPPPARLSAPGDWPRILLPDPPASDPADLDEAVRRGAFLGLRRSVRELGPTATIATLAAARLRGRGGAGFPVADKWRICRETDAPSRTVVVNAYGADPASATDRTLLEQNPYAVLEGATIAALAVGAEEVIVAVRREATTAIRTLEAAIAAAQEAGFLGPDAAGSGRRVEVVLRPLQGAYLLGEETILLKVLEGRRGQPEQRPPYPATRGLWGRPTVVNNPASLAAAAWILAQGPEAFAAIGDPEAPGTVLVDLRGGRREGIVEVPTGIPLGNLVDLAGGPAEGRRLKALLVGGPSAGILPADALETRYAFASLRDAGAHVGSGSVVLVDERACIVDLARLLTRYCSDESCGKTIPCRIGLRRLYEIGARLSEGRSRQGDLQLLTDLADDVADSALCNHERLAGLPLRDAVRYFADEVEAHLRAGRCPAGVCRPISLAAGA
jgi:NADH:ubiquinone oxidoreductase subunit F (NADH-binding)